MTKLKDELRQSTTLEEAVEELFGKKIIGRSCVLNTEEMVGEVSQQYDFLGRTARQDTYKKIVEDFKNSTQCYGVNHPQTSMQVGTILDVGCGSGLLSLELAEQTNGRIIGMDLSQDMIGLALANLKHRSEQKVVETQAFWKKLPHYYGSEENYRRLKEKPPLLDRVQFIKGSVYELSNLVKDVSGINYIVCRNALHRFKNPEQALMQMYQALSSTGQIYLRDLRRDADWKTVVERIGEQRWKHLILVKDYIGAMAGMLTQEELREMFKKLNFNDYSLREGNYSLNSTVGNVNNALKEYADEVEYVAVIKKQELNPPL